MQTPDADDLKYKYYKGENTNTLALKPGHDFPADTVVQGMDYDTFTSQILNKIGNLRIYYRDKNAGRQNTAISLKKYDDFNTYLNIKARGKDIVDIILDYCMPQPGIDLNVIQKSSRKRREAELIDDKYVMYKGEKMTINNWGCKVTGWKSIRIYDNAAIVGQTETLHEKRLAYMREHNETPI